MSHPSAAQAGFRATIGWLSAFLGFSKVFRLSLKKPQKCRLDQVARIIWRPRDYISGLLGTNIKFKDGATHGTFTDVVVFFDFKVCGLVLHALRENNLIQEVFVTFFCFFSE